MSRGDDVDDRLGLGCVFCRGVGDGLYAVERVGRQCFEVGLQVLGGEFGGLVVNPNLHARDAAQCDVALDVHLHARRVLQGVGGRSRLYGGVFADVVNHLLAIHGVEGLLGGDGHLLHQGGGRVH